MFDGPTGFDSQCATTFRRGPCFDDGADIYFSYRASCSGRISIDTCSSLTNFDTTLTVFNSTDGLVTCNDDSCNTRSKVEFDASQGDIFLLRVAGFRSATGVGLLSVLCDPVDCPPWPQPSTCPLTYNASCTRLDFRFKNVLACYGSQGCSCGESSVNPECYPPPQVPTPPCPSPTGDCLNINFQFAELLSAADPRLD